MIKVTIRFNHHFVIQWLRKMLHSKFQHVWSEAKLEFSKRLFCSKRVLFSKVEQKITVFSPLSGIENRCEFVGPWLPLIWFIVRISNYEKLIIIIKVLSISIRSYTSSPTQGQKNNFWAWKKLCLNNAY